MNFLNRLVSIFTAPARVFDDIREQRVAWWQPWLMVSVFYMIITYVGLPIQRAVLELNPSGIPTDQLDKQLEIMQKAGFIWVLMAPIGVLLVSAVVSGLTYMIVTLVSGQATFKQYFTLAFFADLIAMVGQFVSVIVVRARGLDQIMVPEDARFSLSLRALAPPDSAMLKGLFGSVEFFSLWSFVILTMGLMHVFGMKRGQALAVVIPIWLVYVVMLILGEKFGGMGA